VNTLDSFADIFGCPKRELDMNAPEYQYTVVVFNFASSVCRQPPIACIDFARFQRAPEGSQHSACGRSDDVIECGRVGLREFRHVDAIMFRDFVMHAKHHRLFLAR
jgi:hypothetical protein